MQESIEGENTLGRSPCAWHAPARLLLCVRVPTPSMGETDTRQARYPFQLCMRRQTLDRHETRSSCARG